MQATRNKPPSATTSSPASRETPEPPRTRRSRGRDQLTTSNALALLTRWGVVLAFVGMVVTFYLLKSETFGDVDTWRGILDQAAVPAILAMGLTVALIVGDFDLSIGAIIGLAMGIVIILTVDHQMGWLLAAFIALGAGALVGVFNGLLVAGAGVNSFIGTLAMSSIVMGVDAKVTNQDTITSGVPASFADLGANRWLFNFSDLLWIAIGLGVILWIFTSQTESGRFMYAVGGNREAARLAGVRVRGLRMLGFVVTGICAALAGVLLGASSAGYYPNAGTGYLLPAFAAAFLGTSMTGGKFSILATAFSVFFLQTLETGLTVLNVETWIVLVVEGAVLAIAVILGQASSAPRVRRRRGATTAMATGEGEVSVDPINPHQEEKSD